MQAARTKAEVLSQKEKLVNSYNELLQYDYLSSYNVRILLTELGSFPRRTSAASAITLLED